VNDDDWRTYLIAFGPCIALAAALIFLFWTGVL
jgi:hypothetical protein